MEILFSVENRREQNLSNCFYFLSFSLPTFSDTVDVPKETGLTSSQLISSHSLNGSDDNLSKKLLRKLSYFSLNTQTHKRSHC